MYKRVETSESWKAFFKELLPRCQEQDIPLIEMTDWIDDSVGQIEKQDFDYHIVSGSIPEDRSQKIDINILLGKRIYSFTVSRQKKQFNIFSTGDFGHYSEEITEGFIKCTFIYAGGLSFFIMDSIANSAGLRVFAHKVLDLAWGKE
jgi:hypothetical protein